MATTEGQLYAAGWPKSRLGELLENLARRAKLNSHPINLPEPPGELFSAGDQALDRWLDVAAAHLGLEAEPVDTNYSEVEQFLQSAGPAILQLPVELMDDQRNETLTSQPLYLGLIRGGKKNVKVITPDLRVGKLRTDIIHSALCFPYESPIEDDIDQLLLDAEVPPERIKHTRMAILREQLGSQRIQTGWYLRLSPGAKLGVQFRQAGVYRPLLVQFGLYFFQQILFIASWFVLGRALFQGHFDYSWLLAWAILLFSTVPIQIIVSDSQSELSLNMGAIFKQRLLFGTQNLEPDEIRHLGMGQFLSRVMESEAVEMLAYSGGFMALLSFIELGFAFFILSKGAAGWLSVVILLVWVLLTLIILWRYYQISREWAQAYREMTNDLVERMVGHRTRLAQEDPLYRHQAEDQDLDRYLKLSMNMDHIGIWVTSTIPQGWMLLGLASLVIPFISGSASPQAMAISLGGILLASNALGKLTGGAQSLMSLMIAWKQVGPLFDAAQRPRDVHSPDFVPSQRANYEVQILPGSMPSSQEDKQPLIMARDVTFRYRPQSKPVVNEVTLTINTGDRMLLEGPSGGGKSTLAAILSGLRNPESGSLLLWGFDRQIMGAEEWRRNVVMAPQFQENHVFNETFAFNLLMGRRWPPRNEDLQEAEIICRELGLGELLDRMPSGFQQMLGESGWQISHGERSRMFIARTLLQNADLVVLDESFGALDPENLNRSLNCVLNRAPTLVVIAHP
jgi:ATP-binding cassette subfamily B protein